MLQNIETKKEVKSLEEPETPVHESDKSDANNNRIQ